MVSVPIIEPTNHYALLVIVYTFLRNQPEVIAEIPFPFSWFH
jgi:hypothetical protein